MSWRVREDASSIDAAAMWRAEEAMTKHQRRKRYRCGRNFVRLIDVEPLPIYATRFPQYADLHTRVEEPAPEVANTQQAALEAEVAAKRLAEEDAVASKQRALDEAAAAEATKKAIAEAAAATEVTSVAPVVTVEAPAAGAGTELAVASTPAAGAGNENSAAPAEVAPAGAAPAPAPEAAPAVVAPAPTPAPAPAPAPWPLPNKLINRKIATWRGDITRLEIDAVVNAANDSLLGGGGIDGAIHSAAGNQLYRECLTLGGANTGQTKITRAYNLPSKFILHTVGPIGERPEKLRACYRSCLDLAVAHGVRSLAFCGISTGIYGYPLEAATRVALATVRQWLEERMAIDGLASFDEIIFCTFLGKEEECYLRLLPDFFPLAPDAEFAQTYAKLKADYASEAESETPESSEDEDEEDEEDEIPVAPAPPDVAKVEEAKPAEKSESKEKDDDEDDDEDAEETVRDVMFGAALIRQGQVEVELPPNSRFLKEFDDFYYTLTTVGKWAPVYIKRGLKEGKFIIACNDDSTDVVVHWAIRGDSW